MIEVFRTNVEDPLQAHCLLGQIHETFAAYKANFDLQDCDRILRVESANGFVESSMLIGILRSAGFHAEILPDEPLPVSSRFLKMEIV